ncbi:leucine-rich_repeat domain-containing protein [Hexamita inflata]|uniref:Leucine-rich_repeat domain-containing protein n=1 Tax=Hexamita inflata TaxID=28002 RepID=A0ABP1H675_9EUKA
MSNSSEYEDSYNTPFNNDLSSDPGDEYEPWYILKDTGDVFVYNESRLTTFQFVDNVDKKHCGYVLDPKIYFENCPNISFWRVPYSIRKLEIYKCDLQNLKGLSQMNLWELNLSKNKISDISEFRKFKGNLLQCLDLSYNRIVDISPLGLHPETKELSLYILILDLSNNRIININALKDQKDLKELYLTDNYIRNFSPIKRNLKKYPNKIYLDQQYRLNADQKKYQKKYSAYMKSKKKSILISKKIKKINEINYKVSALKALETIKHNFSNHMSQVVVLLKSMESFSDQ